MAALASSEVRWDERIARARLLANTHPAAADLLTFYAALAEYQKSLAVRWSTAIDAQRSARLFPECVDVDLVLEAVPQVLPWLQRTAPAGVVDAIADLRLHDAPAWRTLLEEYLSRRGSLPGGSFARAGDIEPARAPKVFVLEMLLQPLVEQLAARRPRARPDVGGGPNRCPFCDFLPVVGVLREEAEGARRNLVCGLCLTEWNYLRLVCPSCGERQFDALPVYTAEQFPNARLDVCETCRKYLKTIDATKDGLAMPLVDDIASLPLDLWAREQGYVRLQPNLLRV